MARERNGRPAGTLTNSPPRPGPAPRHGARAGPGPAGLAGSILLVTLAATVASPLAAQDRGPRAPGTEWRSTASAEAITYRVHAAHRTHGAMGPARDGGTDPDPWSDPRPRRVIQADSITWLLAQGADPAVREADLVLQENELLTAGPGPLLVRGWREPEVQHHDTIVVTVLRGDRDRDVDGRPAEHYQLLARMERTGWLGRPQVRHLTADLWVLPSLPFTWAPFGSDDTSLPALFPGLRSAIEPRLEPLGLVGRAVIRLGPAPGSDRSGTPGSGFVSAFEISDIRPTRAPPAPGPVIDRAVMDALDRFLAERPARTCREAAQGELPATMRARIGHELWPPLVGHLSSRCRR